MSFTAKDVADLRQKTGAGMMECKNALKEAGGNLDKASEILRQKGLIQAAKKTDKVALEGIVASIISEDKKAGIILEINTQTDFVAKNEMFLSLVNIILKTTLKEKPSSLDELLKLKAEGSSIADLISGRIATIGENIQLRRMSVFNLGAESGIVGSYIHPVGNKIGVMVKLSTSSPVPYTEMEQLVKDLAMHIAAVQPQAEFIDKQSIPKEIIENEKRIEMGKEDLAKKPKEIAEKIVQGRLDKILSQRCLLEQPFIKDQGTTIDKLLQEKGKQLNTTIKILQFVRYNVGEFADKLTQEESNKAVGVVI